jgi:hypothetical protein
VVTAAGQAPRDAERPITTNGTSAAPPADVPAAFAQIADRDLARVEILLGVRWPMGRRWAERRGIAWSADMRDPRVPEDPAQHRAPDRRR